MSHDFIKGPCAQCGHETWIYPDEYGGPDSLCGGCLMKNTRAQEAAYHKQMAEFARVNGNRAQRRAAKRMKK